MSRCTAIGLAVIFLATGSALFGRTLYVAPTGTNDAANYFPSWAGAATSLHAAVSLVTSGDEVRVTNATYALTNQLMISSNILMRSYNSGALDAAGTVINANNSAGKPVTNRCLTLSNINAVVAGFTFTGGLLYGAPGSGVQLSSGLLSNCVVSGNSVTGHYGGGVYVYANGTIANCTISDNTGSAFAGGIYFYQGGIARDCLIRNNLSFGGNGGGAYMNDGGMAYRCTFFSNQAPTTTTGLGDGGGVFVDTIGTLDKCVFRANSSSRRGGGFYLSLGGVLKNSVVIGNTCNIVSGYGGGGYVNGGLTLNSLISGNSAYRGGGLNIINVSTSRNCTVSGNYSPSYGGGINLQNGNSLIENCIVYGNVGSPSNVYSANLAYWTNCCTAPSVDAWGTGNITTNPLFVNTNTADYRLSAGSPCINAGQNQAWMEGAADVAGCRRIDRFSGIVDIGAYEFIPCGTVLVGY